MSRDAEDGFGLSADGPAYTTGKHRHSVPMSYIGEKLGSSTEEPHRYVLRHPEARERSAGADVLPAGRPSRPAQLAGQGQ